ncbi:MAG: hypothetical protein AABX64_00635 [Nanoarchaeota archaeon]
MSYKIGTYRTHLGIELDLDDLALEEGRLFFWLMEKYRTADSWHGFQEHTAATIKETVMKAKQRSDEDGFKVRWEEHPLYQVRYDLLRNVGIRTKELPGDLSQMLLNS